MAYGTVNADVIQSSVANTSLGAGNASIMKNRIINGAMVIDQRNNGASVTPADGAYTLDRWQYSGSQASKFTVQQNAGSVQYPVGYPNYLGATVASAVTIGSGDYFSLIQIIEGNNIADLAWGSGSAKTVTLSFQVYSSLTGTFGGALRNSASNRSYPFSYSVPVANTWTPISITIAGDTGGTWVTNNGKGISVIWSLGTGATYSGTAGSWAGSNLLSATGAVSVVGTAGATFYITGVQLEVGSSSTGFEYRVYSTELANCQRYYQGTQGYYGVKTPSGYTRINIQLPVYMRTTPTVTFSDLVGNASKISIYAANDAQTNNIAVVACGGTNPLAFQVLPNNTDTAPGYGLNASMSAEL
jgi:hypothetical protein